MSNDQTPSPAAGIGPPTGVTIIGQTLRIQGTMTSGEEVHLNGDREGQLEVDGRLTIGTGGETERRAGALHLQHTEPRETQPTARLLCVCGGPVGG